MGTVVAVASLSQFIVRFKVFRHLFRIIFLKKWRV